jgi:uncharacterized protein (TIGR02646 family)
MKYVRKAGEPHEYREWRNQVRGTQDENFPNGLRNPLKARLHAALIHEQGFLCAYTMKRIGQETSHIEHIKPETLCRAECVGSDLDYWNMVACFPREGMRRTYRYGAQERDDWWENGGADFVKPLDPNCEKRFRFDLDGNIAPVNGHAAATKTIEKLGLDHPTLTEDRKRVIREFVFGKDGNDPLSPQSAEHHSAIICAASNRGEFQEFCVAIRDALQLHLRDLSRQARRRNFARRRTRLNR